MPEELSRREGSFRAFVAQRGPEGFSRGVQEVRGSDLEAAELLVEVRYCGLNYKDALASSAAGKVARVDRLIPGIDLAGTVLESSDPAFPPGTEVIGGGAGLGVSHHGGCAQLASLPSEWAVALPAGITAFEAMSLGTAGMVFVGALPTI